MPEPIDWAALKAAYEAAPLPPSEGTLGITDPYLRLTALARNSLGAILAYHEQAEKVREAAMDVANRCWGRSYSETEHHDRITAMGRLSAALGVKP